MNRTAQIIAECLHSDIVKNYNWSEEVRPHFLHNALSYTSRPQLREWFKGMGLRQISMPESQEDLVPASLPDWLKEHIAESWNAPEVPEYPEYIINYVPSLEEVYQAVLKWGQFWSWIPELDITLEELEQLAQEADWICVAYWRDALAENVNKIVRREAIKPYKNF